MSEIVASAIIEKRRLEQFAETFASNPSGMEGELVKEAKIHWNDEGIESRAVDASNVAMVGPANLAPRGFEAYESPGSVTIGVNLIALLERLGPAGASQLIELEVDMETRHLRISYGSAEMSVALIDPDAIRQEPDTNDLPLENTVVITGDQFRHAIDICGMVSDNMTIEGYPDDRQVVFRGEGDTDDNTVSYGDEETHDGTQVSDEVVSRFSTDYLKALAKPIPGDELVTIEFGDTFPMELSWKTFDGAFTVEQQLAPRVGDNA